MKFGKEFKREMVPEWIEAYVDYTGLKHILQEIRHFKESKQPPTPARTLDQRLALYRNFSGLNLHGSVQNTGDIENQVIAVNTVQHENYRKFYKTKFLASPEGAENEIMFFDKLDHEFNKVNTFYKDKVDEVMREVTLLNKQMDALIALRIKVMDPGFNAFPSLQSLSLDINNSTPSRITSPLRMTTVGKGHNQIHFMNFTYWMCNFEREYGSLTWPNKEFMNFTDSNYIALKLIVGICMMLIP